MTHAMPVFGAAPPRRASEPAEWKIDKEDANLSEEVAHLSSRCAALLPPSALCPTPGDGADLPHERPFAPSMAMVRHAPRCACGRVGRAATTPRPRALVRAASSRRRVAVLSARARPRRKHAPLEPEVQRAAEALQAPEENEAVLEACLNTCADGRRAAALLRALRERKAALSCSIRALRFFAARRVANAAHWNRCAPERVRASLNLNSLAATLVPPC